MRHAAVEGQFYPSDRAEARLAVEKYLNVLNSGKKVKAGIVPHAGWNFSGKCAGLLYNLVDRNTENFIILGTNHSGLGSKISFSVDDFDSPLGVAENNIPLAEEIIIETKKAGFDIGADGEAHKFEHSIEVQIPFIKFLNKDAKIVPILIRDLSPIECEKLGVLIGRIAKKNNAFILASSDFTHYGRNYGFLPFKDSIKDNLYSLDGKIIDKILELDVSGFLSEARKSTVCGRDAVAVLISAAKYMKLVPEKLSYCTSGDISGKWDSAVGYASIGFTE